MIDKQQLCKFLIKAKKSTYASGEMANKDFFEMDEILWSLGRSCCKEKTLCADKACNKNPCTFFSFIDIPDHNNCIFEGVCLGSNDESYRKYWQPIVDTHYH